MTVAKIVVLVPPPRGWRRTAPFYFEIASAYRGDEHAKGAASVFANMALATGRVIYAELPPCQADWHAWACTLWDAVRRGLKHGDGLVLPPGETGPEVVSWKRNESPQGAA